ncbi:hypothetical protein ABDD95_21025 [Mucilaginibacter sp. PAMB04274]|uniref:hypothetical protein n=1 Tax=Mucilaginibacter sp. PAMB04274 TaxID=3138568 RepID=UPI0031F6BBEB
MKTLKFSFEHPVRGKLRFRPLSEQTNASICRRFDTGVSTDLTVALRGLEAGNWELTLEWEYEERNYHYQHTFEIGEVNNGLFGLTRYAKASLFHNRRPLHAINR